MTTTLLTFAKQQEREVGMLAATIRRAAERGIINATDIEREAAARLASPRHGAKYLRGVSLNELLREIINPRSFTNF